jgi:solute carrier family 32 (vesicular inhibitory amino acid transporter)
VIVVIAIVFPDFDSIMALMGSALCFTICIILPVAFYLKIFGKEISLKERIFDWFLIVSCSIMAVLGTVWAVLPKDKIGAK